MFKMLTATLLKNTGSTVSGTQAYHLLRRSCSYKSDLSLDKIYPSSNLRLYTPPPPKEKPDGKFNDYIPLDKLKITYSRSSGPGGQNVNTVNTKVDIRFHLMSASWLSEPTRQRLSELHKGRITKEGFFVVKSEATRSQQLNTADAFLKLREIIHHAEKPIPTEPTPDTVERIRRRHEKAARERLTVKRKLSDTKADRQAPTL